MTGIFLFATTSRQVLGPTQPPVKWVSGALFAGDEGDQGVKLSTHD